MSLRRWEGWEPRETTRHYYRDGRLVRSVTTREPEWSDEDRGWSLALALYRVTRCPHCGGDIAECTRPEEDLIIRTPPPKRCKVTDALIDHQKQYKDQPKPAALLWRADLEIRRDVRGAAHGGGPAPG